MRARPGAADVARASASISTALLLPQDRIAREPLSTWAERLLTALARSRRALRRRAPFAGEVAGIANNTALIAVHEGAMTRARSLCDLQVRWQSRFSRRARDSALAVHACQPWVNLGRLEALGGRWEAALARFSGLRDSLGRGWIDLGAVRVRCTDSEATRVSGVDFRQWVEAVYIVDSLKALLLNRKWEETGSFAAGLDGEPPWSPGRFDLEALAIAECKQERFDLAACAADRGARESRGWARVVFRLRRVEAMACSGDTAQAAVALARIAAVVREVSPERKSDPQCLPVMLRVCTACREVGLDADSIALARDVYDGACASDDEALRIESASVLAEGAPAAERGRWCETLAELREATAYSRYRGSGAAPALQPMPVKRLYEELTDFLSV